jgi:23S rRNA (pseudouridine1915-N3)-methyltransferase
MKIVVLSVGRVKQGFVREGEREYLERLGKGFSVELIELGIESPESLTPQQAQEREAVELEKRLSMYEYVVVLDERGKPATSVELKNLVEGRMNTSCRSLCFVIGGSFGFAERVRQRANYILSLSKLTFPHQLTRLILVEQLYRCYTMMRGIGYHK